MTKTQNLSWIYKKVPYGVPVNGEHFQTEDRPFDLSAPPPPGGLVVEILYSSIDPYMRGRMQDPNVKSYRPGFALDQPITAYTLARVLKSDSDDWKEGDTFLGHLPIQQYAAVAKDAMGSFRKISNPYDLDLKEFAGPLGMTGLTAYSSLYEIGKPKEGETIFVSSAAGAVGQIVGQLAKREGLKVIGSVGSDEKLDFIQKELGFDSGFNYKKEKPGDALARLAPDGIDIYYENVGGEHLEAAIDAFNMNGRVVASGMISEYSRPDAEKYGVKNLMKIVYKRILMQGFIVNDENFGPKYTEEHQKNVQKWLKEGSIKSVVDVTNGVENAGKCFLGMLEGKNFGKAALKVKQVGLVPHH